MNKDSLLNISFVSNLAEIKSRPDFDAVEDGLGVRTHIPQLLSELDVQNTLKETMTSIVLTWILLHNKTRGTPLDWTKWSLLFR